VNRRRGYKIDTSNRPPITADVRQRIVSATALLESGKTWKEAAEALEVSERQLLDYNARHKQLWHVCRREAKRNARALLASFAGSPEVFSNRGKLCQLATEDEPPTQVIWNDGMTLREFVDSVYVVSRIDVSPTHRNRLLCTVARLCAFLGKPVMVADLNELDICRFLHAARASRAAASVNTYRRELLALWRSAYDQGIAERPPRLGLIRKLPEDVAIPEAWNSEDVNVPMQQAAATTGMVESVPAGQWWLSLLLGISWTGCRIGALLATPTAAYRDGGILVAKQKNRRAQWYALPESRCRAIDATKPTARKMLWPWHRRALWKRMRAIVEGAGLECPRAGRNLFHRMRRTTLSLCAAVDPAIAQRQAGHSSHAITQAHYIDPRIARGRSAADVLPEPVLNR
jgi:hypothetical protein